MKFRYAPHSAEAYRQRVACFAPLARRRVVAVVAQGKDEARVLIPQGNCPHFQS